MIDAIKKIVPKSIKKHIRRWFPKSKYINYKYLCPICHSGLSSFNRLPDYYFEQLYKYQHIHSIFTAETINILNYSCPSCGASDRDRLYALYLKERFDVVDKSKKYKFVHFAPTRSLEKFIKSYAFLGYRSADFFMEYVDDKVDIMDMKIYRDNSIDIFLCSHVLEHVSDDKKAISELYRILKTDGWGIIMVPILLSLKENYEDPSITSEEDRWKHFGQDDHLRVYSKEGFIKRLEEGGFKVTQLGIDYFGSDLFESCGIYPRSVLYVVEKGL
jgi:SAM-dependent methyltransferase